MKKLFLDTSSKKIFISIYSDFDVISTYCFPAFKDINEKLVENFDFMLNNSAISIEEIDTFLVTVGPGSFTGIRIGFSFLAGLALGLGKEIYGITSLDAFALSVGLERGSVGMKLIGNNYAVREYDFVNGEYGEYLQVRGEEIARFENLVIIDEQSYNVSNILGLKGLEQFFCDPAPFYVRKSEAEINFEKRCNLD